MDSKTKTTSSSEITGVKSRQRRRIKVSFRKKIEYFAHKYISDKNLANAVLDSAQTFDSVYGNLSKIHVTAKLGEEQTKRVLTQAETLLQLWLSAIGKMPHE